MKYAPILLSLLLVLFVSCSKSNISPLLAISHFEELSWGSEMANGNTNLRIKTKAEATTSTIRHLVISTYDAVHLNGTLLDTVFADPLKEVNIQTLYRTPSFEDTTFVTFTTTAYANDGETASTTMKLLVLPTQQSLRPIDDVTIYSALSGKASAFSLSTMTAVFEKDSNELLFFRDLPPADSTDEISCSWTSKTVYFARSESFNFGEATASSVTSTYQSCTHTRTLTNLRSNDVLLYGQGDNALGTIKIIYIADEEGTENDRYVFSIKSIKSAAE